MNYIGTKGTNLLMRRNIAQALPYDPANPRSVAARKPFPNFVVYIDSDSSGRSNYHSMNAKLETADRLAVATVVYTWAKSTDNKSAAAGIGASGFNGWQGLLDNSRPELDRGRSDFDVDHRLVGSFVYNLPFGRGEKFAGSAGGVKNAVVGGWQVNGIVTLAAGLSDHHHGGGSGGLNDTLRDQPGRPGRRPLPETGSESRRWFNTTAFAQPAPGGVRQHRTKHAARARHQQPGSRAVQELRPGAQGTRLQFRFESFNAFNHTQFNGRLDQHRLDNFGVVTRRAPGRINQMGLKLIF